MGLSITEREKNTQSSGDYIFLTYLPGQEGLCGYPKLLDIHWSAAFNLYSMIFLGFPHVKPKLQKRLTQPVDIQKWNTTLTIPDHGQSGPCVNPEYPKRLDHPSTELSSSSSSNIPRQEQTQLVPDTKKLKKNPLLHSKGSAC